MGTRNLVSVTHEGKNKIAQYGQWDGYPSGQGATVLEYLKSWDREKLISQMNRIRLPDDDELTGYYKELGADDSGFISMDISEKFNEKYQFMSRDHGAKILSMVENADPSDDIALRDQSEFANDSLFCEYTYRIDLDENTLIATGSSEASYDLDNLPSVEKLELDIDCRDEE